MKKIVLAHGFLGFGANPLNPAIHYFNGVANALRGQGHEVYEPTVDALGSLEHRSRQLAAQINQHWPGTSAISVIAHSMGGLDTRRVLARDNAIGPRIRTLIAIATPHLGSPVADALLDHSHALRASIPAAITAALQHNAGALEDLRTHTALQDPDQPGVRYMEVVCNAQESNGASLLFNLCRAIGQIAHAGNDGVVTTQSATAPGRAPIAIWPVDHGEAIGWPTGLLGWDTAAAAISPPRDHLERYIALAALL